jgi:hypothetical protein
MISRTRARSAYASLVVASVGTIAAIAFADGVDPKRAHTFVVGPPEGVSPMVGIDARRSGFSGSRLPSGTLRVEWTRTIGASMNEAPVIGANGDVFVVTARGQVVATTVDGDEKWRVNLSEPSTSPPALLSDGTLVFVSGSGDAIGLKDGATKWRTRVGAAYANPVAPLPLNDGGVVVAIATELTMLDAEGGIRARVSLAEKVDAALISARGKVVAVSSVGGVFTWSPGADAERVGSFDAPLDNDVVLANDHDLVGVSSDGTRLLEFDLARNVASTRAVSPGGVFLGPPAVRGENLTLLNLAGRTYVVTIDAHGQETSRAVVAPDAQLSIDGGSPPISTIPHAAPIVDARGVVAYVTPNAEVGIVAPEGSIDTLGASVCTGSLRSRPLKHAQLAPSGAQSFVVACESGALVKVTSAPRPGVEDTSHVYSGSEPTRK